MEVVEGECRVYLEDLTYANRIRRGYYQVLFKVLGKGLRRRVDSDSGNTLYLEGTHEEIEQAFDKVWYITPEFINELRRSVLENLNRPAAGKDPSK